MVVRSLKVFAAVVTHLVCVTKVNNKQKTNKLAVERDSERE